MMVLNLYQLVFKEKIKTFLFWLGGIKRIFIFLKVLFHTYHIRNVHFSGNRKDVCQGNGNGTTMNYDLKPVRMAIIKK